MNKNVLKIGAGLAGITLSTLLIASPAFAVVDDGTWGVWSAPNAYDAPIGALTFANPVVGGATYAFTTTAATVTSYLEDSNTKGDWVASETPAGAVFGANGPSGTSNMLILMSSNGDPGGTGSLVVTFNSPVPANALGLVIADIDSANSGLAADSDRVSVTATTTAGDALTSAQLNGDTFNLCNVPVIAPDMPSNCSATQYTTVPNLTAPSATSLYFAANTTVSGDEGDSGWIHPTADVKTVTLHWDSYASVESSLRVYIAVDKNAVASTPTPEPVVPALANTGTDVTTVSIAALVFGLLGAMTLFAVRRRTH